MMLNIGKGETTAEINKSRWMDSLHERLSGEGMG